MSLSGRKTFSFNPSAFKSKFLELTEKLSFKPLTFEVVLKSIISGSFAKRLFLVIVLPKVNSVEAVVPAPEPSIAKAVTYKFKL